MPGSTASQALPYPYIDEAITDVSTKNLADTIATKLTSQDTARTLALKRATGEARRNTILALADGVNTVVPFDQEIWDTDNMINVGGANPSRITVATGLAGLYHVSGYLGAAVSGSWTRSQITIMKNGGTLVCGRTYGASAPVMLCSGLHYAVNAGDYFELFLLHAGGGSTNVSNANLVVRRVSA